MATNETRQRFTAGGMFLLPVLLVLVTAKIIAPPTVTTVEAALAAVDPVDGGGDARPRATAEQLAAQRHVERLRAEPFGPSPLYYLTRTESPATDGPPRPDGVPPFALRAILQSPRGNTALVDGELYRIGDGLGESSWRIVEISAASRSVTIEHERSGRRAILSVATVELDGRSR